MPTGITNDPNVGDRKQMEAFANPKKLASFKEIGLMDQAVRDALSTLTKNALELADAVKPVKTAIHPDVTISRRTSRFEVTGLGDVKMDTSDGITSEWDCGWRTIEFEELRPGDIFRLWDLKDGVWCPDHYREDGTHDVCVVLSAPFEVTNENGTKTLSVETFRVSLHLPLPKNEEVTCRGCGRTFVTAKGAPGKCPICGESRELVVMKGRSVGKTEMISAVSLGTAVEEPVCSVCNDTHQMNYRVDDADPPRKVPCTSCPTPCEKCREGEG